MKTMLETARGYLRLLLVAVFTLGLTACATDGPFEEAGEEVDEAIEEVDEAF